MITRPYGEAQKINGVIANDLYARLANAEHQRDKAREDYDQAMDRVDQLEIDNEHLTEVNKAITNMLVIVQKYHSEAAANLADAVAEVLGEEPSITDTEEGIQESLEEMRLRPMDEAPRDGTPIIVKERNEDGNWYRLCRWEKPYSTQSQRGAWKHFCDGDSVSHITEQRALGWMPEPRGA